MPKRRAKKKAPKTKSSLPKSNANGDNEPEEPQVEQRQAHFIDLEVERQAAAIRAVRDVEIEHLLTQLRLLRSCFNEEQLQKPVLRTFEENLPNLSVVNDREDKEIEVKWKDKHTSLSNGRDVHMSIFQRLSMAFPQCSEQGRTSLLGSDNLFPMDFSLEEPSQAQTLAMQEALQTPGVSNQRLSVGMTPKTLRLPKPGEMLLSVHGSPLGVYKENNMEPIRESDES